jgi:hypothetical protein
MKTRQDIVDFSDELTAIRHKYGARFHSKNEAVTEAAALWGVQCNECGVLTQVTETISIVHARYSATIRLYETAKGYWHIALDFRMPDSGFGTPASVWTHRAYTSALAARRAAIAHLLKRTANEKQGATKRAELQAFRAKLEAELTPQLSLF